MDEFYPKNDSLKENFMTFKKFDQFADLYSQSKKTLRL